MAEDEIGEPFITATSKVPLFVVRPRSAAYAYLRYEWANPEWYAQRGEGRTWEVDGRNEVTKAGEEDCATERVETAATQEC